VFKNSFVWFLRSFKAAWCNYFIPFIKSKDLMKYYIYLVVALVILMSILKLKIVLAVLILPAVLIYFYLIALFLYWMFEFPKYCLRYYLYGIPNLIDKIFDKSFDEEDFCNCSDIRERLRKGLNYNEIPKDTLLFDIWLFKLKNYKDRLITIIPVTSALIVKSVLIIVSYYKVGEFFEKLLPKDVFYKDLILIILPIAWALYVYSMELHDINNRILKVELLKNLG
jgi:hypothetical protein